ncbi:hypothetical protein Hanom_Chr16g01461271 [Helianthus anomalus]
MGSILTVHVFNTSTNRCTRFFTIRLINFSRHRSIHLLINYQRLAEEDCSVYWSFLIFFSVEVLSSSTLPLLQSGSFQ